MRRTKTTGHLSIAFAVLGCVLALAACGSSSSSSDPSASKTYEAGLKFSQCMRAHGLPNFPDPQSGSGGGIKIPIGSGLNPSSPAFQQAQKVCGKLLPGGGPGSGQASAKAKEQMLQISECMRAHGVSGFPDPTSSPPSNPADFSGVFGRGGSFIAIPSTIDVNSPVFKQAAAACHVPGAGAGPKH